MQNQRQSELEIKKAVSNSIFSETDVELLSHFCSARPIDGVLLHLMRRNVSVKGYLTDVLLVSKEDIHEVEKEVYYRYYCELKEKTGGL